jgi:hypothetical protein
MKQLTLEGEETDEERVRPSTLLWDDEEEEWVLRSQRAKLWPQELYESPEAAEEDEDDSSGWVPVGGDDDDDDPMEVGGIYDIELSYSADFRFSIPATSECMAKERAQDLVDYPYNCADMFQVYSRCDERVKLYEDDEHVPDDWDPYGGTPLWEVYGSQESEQ